MRKPQPWDRCTRLNKIYKFLKTQEGKIIQRNMRWWSARNVLGQPLKLTKSCTCLWLVEEKVAEVLYRIKPYDDGNPFPTIVVQVGRLRSSNWQPLQDICQTGTRRLRNCRCRTGRQA